MRLVVGTPNTEDLRHLPEIIYVPVRTARWLQVMFNACSHTTRAEGAAEVQIKPRIKMDPAKAPDLQLGRCLKLEKKRVRSRC
jgi:hypothetical protein